MDNAYIIEHVKEELEGAKDYVVKGINNNDIKLISMGIDEIGHAKYFFDKVDKNDTAEYSDIAGVYNSTIDSIYTQLTKYGATYAGK